jgi:hypothetical protein
VSQYLETMRNVALLHVDADADSKSAVDFADLNWHDNLGQFCGTPSFFDAHSKNSRVRTAVCHFINMDLFSGDFGCSLRSVIP